MKIKSYLNVSLVVAAVAIAGGTFAYKQFGSRHIVKALGGTQNG